MIIACQASEPTTDAQKASQFASGFQRLMSLCPRGRLPASTGLCVGGKTAVLPMSWYPRPGESVEETCPHLTKYLTT
jgi:hypothetical protein